MKLADYPPQEALSPAGSAYGAECWEKGEGVAGDEFAFGPDPYQRLLVFRAARPDGRVLLFWHGGGWTSGYKEWMAFMAPAFTAAGVTFVSSGYRLAPQHVFPTALDDCAAAVAWVVREIAAHGGDARQLFIGGHSAGGHYATMLAVNGRALAAVGLPASTVRGCLPLSGVYDFGPEGGLSVRPRFLGADPQNDLAASAMAQIEAPVPPFLVAWGANDFPHLISQASSFVAALQRAGGTADSIEMAGRTHFGSSFAGGEPEGPWVPAALGFMASHARR